MSDDVEGAVGPDRRAFIKRLAIGAFAVPIVSSFTMAGVEAVLGGSAGAQTSNPNTNDPNDEGDARGDGDGDGDNKNKNKDGTSTSTTPGAEAAGAAAAVQANPKFTG